MTDVIYGVEREEWEGMLRSLRNDGWIVVSGDRHSGEVLVRTPIVRKVHKIDPQPFPKRR